MKAKEKYRGIQRFKQGESYFWKSFSLVALRNACHENEIDAAWVMCFQCAK